MLELPLLQKAPFRYVDEVECLDSVERTAVLWTHLDASRYRWSEEDQLPGYLLMEAMAQAAGVLLRHLTAGEAGGFLVMIENARLPERVRFPASLRLTAEMTHATPPIFSFSVTACQSHQTVANAQLSVISNRSFT